MLPFLLLLYLIAYIDRSNISVAALQMNADLGLTARMYGLGAGLFYVTYIVFEVPSNVMLAAGEAYRLEKWVVLVGPKKVGRRLTGLIRLTRKSGQGQ